MNFFKEYLSRGGDFYLLLLDQSQKTLEGMTALCEYMATGNDESGQKVIAIEKEADELRRILIGSLNNSLVTPIDREDIFRLSGEIDDIADYARTTIEEMNIYELKPNEDLREMAKLLLEATQHIYDAIKHVKDNKAVANVNTAKAKKLENKLETLYRIKLNALVQHDDYSFVFKMREVYRHISNLADRVDIAANTIEHIVVKAI
jgi:predicted phosphate transport protein (TIGR00153 family)